MVSELDSVEITLPSLEDAFTLILQDGPLEGKVAGGVLAFCEFEESLRDSACRAQARLGEQKTGECVDSGQ